MKRQKIRIGETIITLLAEEKYFSIAEEEIKTQRRFLEDYIRRDPLFRIMLKPYPVRPGAPDIVQRMAEASSRVGVGPMAAVAGAIAECALRKIIEAGAIQAIVDNGGDIAMSISSPVTVGIYAGEKGAGNLGLRFRPQRGVIGVCTSSATVGPSLSFGRADAATVIAGDVALADAAATALGNAIRNKDRKSIKEEMDSLLVEGIQGMMAIIEDTIGLCGDLPEIVKVHVDHRLITKG